MTTCCGLKAIVGGWKSFGKTTSQNLSLQDSVKSSGLEQAKLLSLASFKYPSIKSVFLESIQPSWDLFCCSFSFLFLAFTKMKLLYIWKIKYECSIPLNTTVWNGLNFYALLFLSKRTGWSLNETRSWTRWITGLMQQGSFYVLM